MNDPLCPFEIEMLGKQALLTEKKGPPDHAFAMWIETNFPHVVGVPRTFIITDQGPPHYRRDIIAWLNQTCTEEWLMHVVSRDSFRFRSLADAALFKTWWL